MKVHSLQTEGFRGLADRSHSFALPGSTDPLDVILVTGEPASGKTTLLEAVIAAKEDVGGYGVPRAGSCLRAGARTARLEATWWLSPAERKRAGVTDALVTTVSVFGEGAPPLAPHPEGLRALFASHSCARDRGKVELFHAARALPPTRGARVPMGAPPTEAHLRLLPTNEKYRAIRGYIVSQIQADNQAVADAARERGIVVGSGQFHAQHEIREMLRPFLREKVFDGIDTERGGYRVCFRCKDSAVLDLEELSASEQQGVLFALTFRQLGLHHSIVLVDEPELHVHPAYAQPFVAALGALGRDNQILAATTSERLLREARDGHVIDLSPAMTSART